MAVSSFEPLNQLGNPYSLSTLSPTGEKPKSRLSDARQGMELFGRLKRSSEPRLERARIIQGMRDGNPPFSGEKLRQRNEGWRSNFSTQEGPSRVDAAKTPFYHLITSAETYATCDTELASPEVDAATASRIRSEEFHRMLQTNEDFQDEWWVMFDDMVLFNRGFFHFPEPGSWRFEHIPWNLVYFPDHTSVKRRKWNYFAIEHHWTVHELYKMSRGGGSTGWRQEAVTNAIRNAVPEQVVFNQRDPLAIQAALADSELYTSECSEQIHAASIYVQEFDGTWTCMIVSIEAGGTEPGASSSPPSSQVEAANRAISTSANRPQKDWLYRREKVATRVTEILCPFFYETSNGFVNSTKSGLGSRILSIMQAMDRSACAVNDNVQIRSSIILQPLNASSRAKTAMMQLGPISIVPDGYNVQNSTIVGDVEGGLAVRDHFARVVDTTTGTFRPTFEKPQGNPEPVGTAQLRFAQSAQLSDSAVERFYKRADTFYYEVYERAVANHPDSRDSFIQAAREFQRRCKNRGLSQRQIEDCSRSLIRASRTIGNGSPAMKQQNLMAIAPLAMQGLFGPRGMHAWKVMTVAAYLGQNGVNQLLPAEDQANVPSRDDWDASQENADMNQGNPPVIAGWQNHVIHALSHMQAGFAAVQAVQAGADPASPFTFMQVALSHIEQHIGAAAPEAVQKQLAAQFKELIKAAKVVEQAAQQKMQQQQQAQQLSFDQQLKQQEMMGKLQLSQAKMEGTMALKAERQQQEMTLKAQQQGQSQQLDDAGTAASITADSATTVADIRNQQVRTAAEIELQRRKAEAEIENQRRKAAAQAEAARNKPKPGGSK